MVAVRLIHNSSRKHTCLVMVDDEDRTLLFGHTWYSLYDKGHYYIQQPRGGPRLHRQVLGLTTGDGFIVDHINRNTCDNHKANLRFVTGAQNMQNRRLNRNSMTGCKGVHHTLKGSKSPWYGHVDKDKVRYGKHFATKEEADTWVRAKREELHGEYARHA